MQASSLELITTSESSASAARYVPPVRDIQEIRYQNLLFLIQECGDLLGRERGAQTYLSSLTGVPASLISMLVAKTLHSDTGKRRLIGDDTATKLEKGMGKEPGWMDVDRSLARDWREAATLDKLRQLSTEQRDAVERMLDALLPPSRPDGAPGSNHPMAGGPTSSN